MHAVQRWLLGFEETFGKGSKLGRRRSFKFGFSVATVRSLLL